MDTRLLHSAPTAWHRVSAHARDAIDGTWRVFALDQNSASSPAESLSLAESEAVPVHRVSGTRTAASALRQLGLLSSFDTSEFERRDWWFHTVFIDARTSAGTEGATLRFDGLATIVDVWLNGQWLGQSDNMFVQWEAGVTELLRGENSLVLCARAMGARLAPRRPRARWRSRLLASQEWRWHRTTHMGRMPGVGPSTPPVGAWRPITLERSRTLQVKALSLEARYQEGRGALEISARVSQVDVGDYPASEHPVGARLHCGEWHCALSMQAVDREWTMAGAMSDIPCEAWWPHTHGSAQLYDAHIAVAISDGTVVRIELGELGFRDIRIDTVQGAFSPSVNGVNAFLRGTCWAPRDWCDIDLKQQDIAREMQTLVDAGINCIRLSGCFTYASEAFLTACDRAGILVWQDLMFSVLDYPGDDDAFLIKCRQEVTQVLASMCRHPSLMLVCGSAEVAQQAAMMRVPPGETAHELFDSTLRDVVQAVVPRVPYWPSTPWGGALPFANAVGTAHYFGVGAYMRGLDDARRSEVRFATECLAFAHVPEPELFSAPRRGGALSAPLGSAEWKQGVPRDGGADWDFEDVRDHYVERLFGEVATELRTRDPMRYLALGRAVSVVTVERTLQEFRRPGSTCAGALTWLWADPRDGAGWGAIDHAGRKKSAWYAMRRASRPVAIALMNEGLNGAVVHAWNDSNHDMSGTLTIRLLRDGETELLVCSQPLAVPGRSAISVSCDSVIGHFTDIVHAYRFGAPQHDVVHAVWTSNDEPGTVRATWNAIGRYAGHDVIDDATLLPHGYARATMATGLSAEFTSASTHRQPVISLRTDRLATFVRIGGVRYEADDSYFMLTPGMTRIVALRDLHEEGRFGDLSLTAEAHGESAFAKATRIVVEALNDPQSRLLEYPREDSNLRPTV